MNEKEHSIQTERLNRFNKLKKEKDGLIVALKKLEENNPDGSFGPFVNNPPYKRNINTISIHFSPPNCGGHPLERIISNLTLDASDLGSVLVTLFKEKLDKVTQEMSLI